MMRGAMWVPIRPAIVADTVLMASMIDAIRQLTINRVAAIISTYVLDIICSVCAAKSLVKILKKHNTAQCDLHTARLRNDVLNRSKNGALNIGVYEGIQPKKYMK